MTPQIPERIFKMAADNNGIPFDFHEDENALTIIMVDGRKLVFEKENGTRKRIQQAEAEQAEAELKQAEAQLKEAAEVLTKAQVTFQEAEAKAKALRLIADGKAPAAPVTPAPEPKKAGRK